jgi:hypothetical protein
VDSFEKNLNKYHLENFFAIKIGKKNQGKIHTVIVPSIIKVGSGPMESIKRTVVNATSVLTLACRGTVITMAADTIITAQVRADQCVLTSRN